MVWLRLYIIISFLLQYQTGFSLHNYSTTSKTPLCRQEQRQFLLQLKQQLSPDRYYISAVLCDIPYDYYKTMNWNQSRDCCQWEGVTCDESTGFVTGLDLSCGSLAGNTHSNSTLFRLTHLRNLNLAFNNFVGSEIPSEFGWLNSLTHLNLSNSGFSGRIPREFYYLSHLVSLDISWYQFDAPQINCDLNMLLRNMTEIRVLLLRHINISSEMPMDMSSSLTHLDLSFTGLQGKLPVTIFEKPNLQVLLLNYNSRLKGSLPTSLNRSNVHSIKDLDLSGTSISGRLPESIGFMSTLNSMDISHCKFSGPIPESIGNMTGITEMDLSDNEFSGQFPSTISNLRRLTSLNLSWNHLEGQIPDAFSNLQELTYLCLSSNSLVGQIPSSLTNMSQLGELDISSNALTGFPSRAGQGLQSLYYMDLSHNCIEGYQPWQHLERLQYLYLQSNALGGTTFLSSICNLTYLSVLNLSNNKLRGKIPDCIGNSSGQLWVLDLRSNEFHGTIPTTLGDNYYLANLGLNHNHFEGPLPPSLANCAVLEVLDLGNNRIHDSFPSWLQTLHQLKILILKSNRFYGSIEPTFLSNSFSELQIIDLSQNNFTGLLPDKLFARLQSMKNQDEAPINGLYLGGGNYDYQCSVTLSVKGKDLEFPRVLRILTTIDLSSNNFQGCIPESLAYLSSLRLLNLSHNSIHGSIPPAIGHMTQLEQLDLSCNQLTGGIPQAITNLTFLEVLNLSYNHLAGPIPQGNQFSTFSSDSYIGNLGLCRAPLTKNYGDGKAPPSPLVFQEEDDDSSFMMGFTWKAVVMGYGCGMVIGFILGNVTISIGKPKWFARFYYAEAANCMNWRKKRGRVVQGRR